jgi:hypothetical protein
MSSNTSSKTDILFPILVSGLLLVLMGILIALIFHWEARLFVSSFDRLGLNLLFGIILILSLVWILLLFFESFSLSFNGFYRTFKWLLFFIYYALGRIAGWILRIKKENVQTSFLAFQNRIFFANTKKIRHPKLLMLLPHCLQFHDCRIRITRDINDCVECGKCNISELKSIGKKYGLKIGIANGGTLARKIVNDNQPDIIIAVACHRDLTDGVRESWKYPVYAILNERPFGPCYDTLVSTTEIEYILNKIT